MDEQLRKRLEEAIALAKEWLKENYHLFDHFDKDEVISDFESDMNKLWEGRNDNNNQNL